MSRVSSPKWGELLEAYRLSGVTQREFCERHGIGLSTLQYQLRKERSETEQGGFFPVLPTPPEQSEQVIEIRTSGGTTIRIPS